MLGNEGIGAGKTGRPGEEVGRNEALGVETGDGDRDRLDRY